jgi:dTDP-glucose 4,6-dehydratase
MTIIITGGAGFIGANFVLKTIKQSNEAIVNLDNLTYAGNLDNLSCLENDSRHIFVRGDIGDQALVSGLLEKYQPRAIINFAAESHVDRSIDSPLPFVQTNVFGTFNLLECTRQYLSKISSEKQKEFRFLHVSTDEVYGTLEKDEPAFEETTSYKPNSPYSASKAASDHFVRAYYHTYNLPVLTTNCSNNYGPLQFPEKLIPLTICNALAGKELPIYGDGKQIRDWLFVEDHCDAIAEVLNKGKIGEVYNIGGNNEKTNIELVNHICEILDEIRPRSDNISYKNQIAFVKDRPGHDRRYAINSSRISKELGWTPKTSFTSGIRKTIEWYSSVYD